MKVLSESRDPAIKLFGKTIPLIPSSAIGEAAADAHKGSPYKAIAEAETQNKEQESPNSEQGRNEHVISNNADDATEKPSSEDQESDASEKEQKTAEEQRQQNDSGNPQEKPTLKKPDKILPCPRCSSMDTKFCYYNNYNVNQPRHFCKNCQRYWTAGGTMRNVPVGAGRRKNKNSAANHYHHLTMADAALQAIPDAIHHPTLKHNGTVLSFGSDTPLCESMASVLNIAEKTMKNCTRNGFQRFEEQRDEQSTGSSAPASNSTDGGAKVNSQEPALRSCQSFPPHLPYINGSPWLYPAAAAAAAPFGPGSFPVPIYPGPAYWACNAWGMPWLAPMASPSTATVSSASGPNSPTLGKHSRDGNVLQRNTSSRSISDKEESARQSINQEKCLWFPKTLRIDDPEEAARSSIWATIGFKSDKSDGVISHGGLFKAFQTKEDQLPNHKGVASQALYANPAALSRSISFQEST